MSKCFMCATPSNEIYRGGLVLCMRCVNLDIVLDIKEHAYRQDLDPDQKIVQIRSILISAIKQRNLDIL